MLPDALLKTVREVMRQSQNGTFPISLLAERLCMLFRLIALKSDYAVFDVTQVRTELEPYVPEVCVLDAIFSQVLSILEGDRNVRPTVNEDLDVLLEEVRNADAELAEQLSALYNAGNNVLVLGEREGGFVEKSLKEAAEGIFEEDPTSKLNVTVVTCFPDHEGFAEGMAERLRKVDGILVSVYDDTMITEALTKSSKIVLSAIGLDVDDGALCHPGSSLICGAANRLHVPVVVAVPRHRIVSLRSTAVTNMSRAQMCPGIIWDYSEARDNREREAISVIAPKYDLVRLQKCEMVATESGGYASEYARALAPCLADTSDDAQQE